MKDELKPQLEALKFKPEELNDALWHTLEVMERCALSFVLLNDTGRSIRCNALEGQEITIGVRQAEFIKEAQSTLRTLVAGTDVHIGINDFKETSSGFEWQYKGIPVKLHIIKRNYEFLRNPEPVWFWGETLFVPNPFDKYYKARYLIK